MQNEYAHIVAVNLRIGGTELERHKTINRLSKFESQIRHTGDAKIVVEARSKKYKP